jgi:hypothetical protein
LRRVQWGHKAKWEYSRAAYRALSQSGAEGEEVDAERIFPEHRLPQDVRDTSSPSDLS